MECLNKKTILLKYNHEKIYKIYGYINIPNRAQNPNPAATVMDNNKTPAIPIPACDLTESFHCTNDTATYKS